jgi:hypothetical protein
MQGNENRIGSAKNVQNIGIGIIIINVIDSENIENADHKTFQEMCK